jgi:hypothetical protein
MKTTKKSQPAARKPGRPPRPEDAVERQMVGTRLSPSLYQKLVDAAAANGRSISAEMEKRVEQSFESSPTNPDSVLQDLGHRIVAAFEAGGQRASRIETKTGGELPASEWIENPSCYTEAASRALEVLADEHPRPAYGQCLRIIYALRARLDRAWHELLMDMTLEEARAEKKKAIQIVETMSPTPSLLDPLYFPVKEDGR